MSGVKVIFEDGAVRMSVQRLLNMGRNPQPLLRGIATLGESQTRMHFREEKGPDGPWEDSRRKRDNGGKTLTANGILSGSITSNANIEYAEWGTNMIYGGVHQFGAEIKPVRARKLVFRSHTGRSVAVDSVLIPQRAFLGFTELDRLEMDKFISRKIAQLAQGSI
jgi:phage virion morphogenesis protein